MKLLLQILAINLLINKAMANEWSLLVTTDKLIKLYHQKLNSEKFEMKLDIPQLKCLISEIGKDKRQNETRMIICNHFNEKNKLIYQSKNLLSCLELNNKTSFAITAIDKNCSILINLECKK